MSNNIFGAIENTDAVFTKEIILSDNCAHITMQLPKWVELNPNGFVIRKLFPNSGMGELIFNLYCQLPNSTSITETVVFNNETKEWEINPKQWQEYNEEDQEDIKKSMKISQLSIDDKKGWLFTQLGLDNGTGYNKYLSFCLEVDSNKMLCGNGLVQELVYKDDTRGDYENMIKKFIESIKFLPDNS